MYANYLNVVWHTIYGTSYILIAFSFTPLSQRKINEQGMSTQRTQKISLAVCQQCTVQADGVVEVALIDGVVEIAGVVLCAEKRYTFLLRDPHRSLVLYSLEGGSVHVFHSHAVAVEINKRSTELSTVVSAVRRDAQRGKRCVVAVVGGPYSGKTLVAQTVANILAAASKRQQNGPGVYYVDATGTSSSVVPATVTCTELHSGVDAPLWPGHAAAPNLQCSFWLGLQRSAIGNESIHWFLQCLSQMHSCVDAFAKNKAAVVSSSRPPGHVVYDLPSSDGTVPLEILHRHTLDIIRPTHVVTLQDTSPEASSKEWHNVLREDYLRAAPTTEFIAVAVNAGSGRSSIGTMSPGLGLSLADYFQGTLAYPLGAAKVVVPLSSLRWLRVGQRGSRDDGFAAETLVPSQSIVEGTLCALSHALLDVEVPLANIAGVVYVACVDEAHDECVLVLPSGEGTLPGNILVLPPKMTEALPWKLSEEERAVVEASVV